jgi:hypothetical protein
MNKSLRLMSKTDPRESARKELNELFMKDPLPNNTSLTEERAQQILEEEMQRLGFSSRPPDARTRATDIEMREREMSLREREAGVNTSKAITGVMATWAVIGAAMLARSCINFDNSPKFRVDRK